MFHGTNFTRISIIMTCLNGLLICDLAKFGRTDQVKIGIIHVDGVQALDWIRLSQVTEAVVQILLIQQELVVAHVLVVLVGFLFMYQNNLIDGGATHFQQALLVARLKIILHKTLDIIDPGLIERLLILYALAERLAAHIVTVKLFDIKNFEQNFGGKNHCRRGKVFDGEYFLVANQIQIVVLFDGCLFQLIFTN